MSKEAFFGWSVFGLAVCAYVDRLSKILVENQGGFRSYFTWTAAE